SVVWEGLVGCWRYLGLVVSPAVWDELGVISIKRGLRYIRNRMADTGDPYGIPVSIGDIFSESLSKLKLAPRSLRKDSTHLTVFWSSFIFLIICSRRSL